MQPSYQLRARSSLLHRLTLSSVLSLSLWGLGASTLGIINASAQPVPSAIRVSYTLLNQGLVNQAIARFEQAIRRYPQSLEARLGVAIAYRRAGRDADALQAYEQALVIAPTNRLALLSVGTLGGYRTEWQERGIAALTTLLQATPNDTEALAQRALLYVYQGQFEAAIADYELVLQNEPPKEVIAGAAHAYALNRNYERSLALFERYRQSGGTLQNDEATAYARALRETGNPTAAVQALVAPLQQQRSLTDVTLRMRAEQAINYAATGRFDLANTMLAPLKGRSDCRMVLGRTLISIGRISQDPTYTSDGIALFRTVLAEAPTSTTILLEIADVLAGLPGSQAAALDVYRRLPQAQLDEPGIQTQIAILEHETGQLSETELLNRLTQVLKTIPDEADQQRAIAQALVQVRTPSPLLLPLYENLVRAGVTEPLLYFRIAQMYVRQGNYDTARDVLTVYQATPAGKTDVAGELILAGIDQREGNLEVSARRYNGIINSNPTDRGLLSGALQGLAGIYQSQGKFREALVLYNRVMTLNPDSAEKQLGLTSLQYQAGVLSQAAAESVLSRWLETHPLTQTPPELYSLVAALPANPRIELLYRTLVQADATYIPVQERLVEVMAERDQRAAMAYIEQLITRDPDNINIYFLKGNIAQEVDDIAQAILAYETILELDPDNLDALASLGGVRFQQRRFDAAVDLYSQILAIQPDHPIARSALASLENVRRFPRRIPALRRAQRMDQAESLFLPDLSSLEPQQEGFEILPQGEVPLPWEQP